MSYREDKVEEIVLALLGVFEFENGRVWKRYDFACMEALHGKGWITSPKGRHESVYLTDEGLRLAKLLAEKHFGTTDAAAVQAPAPAPADPSATPQSLKS